MIRLRFAIFPVAAALLLAACAGQAAPAAPPRDSAQPQPAASGLADVSGIVDPANLGWPRQVEVLNGLVTIPRKPQRILTLSLGHDEITLSLVPADLVVAVGEPTKLPIYSNVAHLVQDKPLVVREPEVIIAYDPDIVVVSKFAKPEFVQAIESVGIPVVQTGLKDDPAGRIDDIRLMGYVYGEEDRAEVVAAHVAERLKRITSIAAGVSDSQRPRVLSLTSYSGQIYAGGADSTEGGIIRASGGRNAAAEAGLTLNPIISLESVIAMQPDVIIVPQTIDSATPFIEELLSDPVLAAVPAVKERRVYHVPSRFFTTLSFWNVRGVEVLAALLWPEQLGAVDFPPFAVYE